MSETQIEALVTSARDALTDDMVGRLASTGADALDLIDRLNRSRVTEAISALTRLVDSGDLERIVQAARVLGAMEDALNEEMVARLAGVLTDVLSLLEQLSRNNALSQILTFLLRPEVQTVLVRWGEALLAASNEYQRMPAPQGGVGGWWRLLGDPGNQRAMQFFGLFGRELQGQREPSRGGAS